MSRSYSQLCFDPISSRQADGSFRASARFNCSRCGAHELLPLVKSAKSFNPEMTIRKANEAGWQADAHTPGALCPACMRARAATRAGERPAKSIPTSVNAEVIAMNKPSPVAVEPKPLTNEQRLKVRALLDKHFDDAPGRYLDGYSDQRIAIECGTPRVHVERIREAAYGPIRVTPEVEAAEAAIKALEARASLLRTQVDAFKAELSVAEGKVVTARMALKASA